MEEAVKVDGWFPLIGLRRRPGRVRLASLDKRADQEDALSVASSDLFPKHQDPSKQTKAVFRDLEARVSSIWTRLTSARVVLGIVVVSVLLWLVMINTDGEGRDLQRSFERATAAAAIASSTPQPEVPTEAYP
jgi:hypothetical protein